MSDQLVDQTDQAARILQFPVGPMAPSLAIEEDMSLLTPTFNKLIKDAQRLDKLSKYPSTFDYSIYRDLELRYKDRPIRGGITKSNPFKLVNSHSTCQQCLYAFEVDTYGRGCSHNCTYCYAKAELTVHGYWNNPIPVPIDINEVRKIFYTVFETDKKSKWRNVMESKIPLRVGCMSDSFMWMDAKYKVTQEFLKILNHYEYPYTIITRSDLVAHDDYIKLLRKDLCSVQFSIASTNDELNRKIEPGAPSAKRRLKALEKLNQAGLWTAVRINPMFPIHPDGYFTDPSFAWDGPVPRLEYSSFEMVDEIADAGVPAIICGFGRFSSFSMNNIERATGINFRQFFNRGQVNKSSRDWHYSDKEIRYYYEEVKKRTIKRAMEFTVCYIGNGENQFWNTQDLWSNKKDCCNIKDRVQAFKTDSRQVPFNERVKVGGKDCYKPINADLLHVPLGIPRELAKPKRTADKELNL
ncbi:MAG: radical SAM protein [Bdellovibrionaceae bacterium]|nr:radical SAM protein [Pseudobdellovibrionaceae bacterium]